MRDTLSHYRIEGEIRGGGMGLNVLNDTAEESLTADDLFSANFGQPTVFVDPRRAMVSVRLNLER